VRYVGREQLERTSMAGRRLRNKNNESRPAAPRLASPQVQPRHDQSRHRSSSPEIQARLRLQPHQPLASRRGVPQSSTEARPRRNRQPVQPPPGRLCASMNRSTTTLKLLV